MANPDTAGLIAPPPLIFLAFLLAGLGLDYLWPYPLLREPLQYWLGGAVILCSFAMVFPAFRAFKRAGTEVNPKKPTTAIVSEGSFRFSRNPLYLSLAVLVAGIAVAADAIWVVAMLVPTLVVIRYGVIAREEAYLERKFGEEYLAYKARVRRWF